MKSAKKLLKTTFKWGLLFLSLISFVLGISLPFFKVTKFWMINDEISILSSVSLLWKDTEYFLCLVTLLFSIIFPLAKYVLIFLSYLERLSNEFLSKSLQIIGKWSMTEIFSLAVFIVVLKMRGFYFIEVSLKQGALFFGAAVITSILLTFFLKKKMSINS